MTARDVTGAILCGGRGERLGGVDKPLIDLAGTTLVGQVIGAMRPCVLEVIISCNRNQADYARLADRTIADAAPYNGPLQGIAGALDAATTRWVLIAPGDTPHASTALFTALLDARDTFPQATALVAHDGEYLQPLFCVLDRSLAAAAGQLAKGGAVHAFLREAGAVHVNCAAFRADFANINTAEDLATLKR